MDTRKSLNIMRQQMAENENAMQPAPENGITDEELNEEIAKFNENVIFNPKEVFGQFIKNENMIQWGGVCDGQFNWTFTVSPSSENSSCTIQLEEPMKLNDENIDLLNKLKMYYNTFYDYWKTELGGN